MPIQEQAKQQRVTAAKTQTSASFANTLEGQGFAPFAGFPSDAIQRRLATPHTLSANDILQLQRTVGNQAVNNLLRGQSNHVPPIQAKLEVGASSDKYEAEADQVASRVVQQGGSLQRAEVSVHPAPKQIQRTLFYKHSKNPEYRIGDDLYQKMYDNLAAQKFDQEVLDGFKGIHESRNLFDLDLWLNNIAIDKDQFYLDTYGYHPGWEAELFSAPTQKGRLRGGDAGGYYPHRPDTGSKMLKKVGRTNIYAQDDDSRVLQLLRQISTQLYLFLQVSGLTADKEQEMQTMWTHGNLVMACNQVETSKNLFKELTKVPPNTARGLYKILTEKHTGRGKIDFSKMSQRHGNKLDSLYKGLRHFDPLVPIVTALRAGNILQVSDLSDPAQLLAITANSGGLYILTAESPQSFSHAEQRLIELRELMHKVQSEPAAWVAGKKRPCFGCWVREDLTNRRGDYTLHFQDQPGKAFKGTYRDAPPEEKGEWRESLKRNVDQAAFESDTYQGEAGPESDSEDEGDSFKNWEDVHESMAKKTPKNNKRQRVIKDLAAKSGVDYGKLEMEIVDNPAGMSGPEFTAFQNQVPTQIQQPWELNLFPFIH